MMSRIPIAIVLGLAVVTACRSDNHAQPTPAAADPGSLPKVCLALLTAQAHLIDCSTVEADKDLLRKGRESEQKLWAGALPAHHDEIARQCATELEGDIKLGGCDLGLDADAQKLIDDVLAKRTDVAATGDNAVDGIIRRIEELRDQACACTTKVCARAADQEYRNEFDKGDALAPVRAAPQEVRDRVGKIVTEFDSCAVGRAYTLQ